MSKTDDEELDPREGLLHPRHRAFLTGHEQAETRILEAYVSGKFHHAWLLTGPRGIGKATLAYRIARYLLRNPVQADASRETLAIAESDAVSSQVSARSHPDLLVIQREVEKGNLKTGITVDTSRKAAAFFNKTAGAGGWRIAIVDAIDDMNNAAANAVLKTLEEPPAKSVFILVCHQRGKLLPTIRSRCIELPMAPLSEVQTTFVLEGLPDGLGREASSHVALAGGRPGLALELAETGAGAIFDRFAKAAYANRLDMKTRMNVANALHGRGTDDRFTVFCALLDDWLTARASSLVRQQSTLRAGQALAQAHTTIGHSIRETNALNLDRRLTVLQAFDLIEQAQRA